MRDQWLDEQDVDHSDEFSYALWRLREYGPEPDEGEGMMIGGPTL